MSFFHAAAIAMILHTGALAAQDATRDFVVPIETAYTGTPGTFLLDGKEIVSGRFQPASAIARNVVFVLDTASHQSSLMTRSQEYVAALASHVQGVSVTFTLITTNPEPAIAIQTDHAGDLETTVLKPAARAEMQHEKSRPLEQGIRLALERIAETEGDRVVVLLSDGDDDLSNSGLKELKNEFVQAHTRFFSILIAYHDFFGTKAHSAWGVKLNSLARFTGADQYETNWQHRASDTSVLMSVAARVSAGGQIRFSLPSQMAVRPGVHRLTVRVDETGASMKSGPFVVASPGH